MRSAGSKILQIRFLRLRRILTELIALFLSAAGSAHSEEALQLTIFVNASPPLGICKQSHGPCLVASSLSSALAVAQQSSAKNALSGSITNVSIVLNKGVYRISQPVNIQWGNEIHQGTLELRGDSEGGTVISGAVRLIPEPGMRIGDQEGLDSTVESRLIELRMPEEIGKTFDEMPRRANYSEIAIPQLFENGQLLQVARYPKNGYMPIGKVDALKDGTYSRVRPIEKILPKGTQGEMIVAQGYFGRPWAEDYALVEKMDQNWITIDRDGLKYGVKENGRFAILNSKGSLNSPGEWVADPLRRVFLVFPLSMSAESSFETSAVDTLLTVDNSKKVFIHDLTLSRVRRNAIRVTGGQDIRLERLFISDVGRTAIVFDNCFRCGGSAVRISNTGESGVFFSGGDRTTLTSSEQYFRYGEISNFGMAVGPYKPALDINGVGVSVEGNYLHDGPHSAVIFRGNNHRIAFNDIDGVVKDTSDAGAIYGGRDWAGRGTIIEGNAISKLGTSPVAPDISAIYLDDQISGISVRGNLLSGMPLGVDIGGGRNIDVSQNIFFEVPIAIRIDARGKTWQGPNSSVWNVLLKSLDAVPYRTQSEWQRYPDLSRIEIDDVGAPKYDTLEDNLILGDGIIEIVPPAEQWVGSNVHAWSRSVTDRSRLPISTDRPVGFNAMQLNLSPNQRIYVEKLQESRTRRRECLGVDIHSNQAH